tara:strand:+ start:456 stop:2387 length:1932 start_codon:yes stop_codon:yes gene_type:complete
MADDVQKVKDLKQAQDIANKAIKEGNDLTRSFGQILQANLKDAKGINVAIKSASDIIQRQLKDKKSDLSNEDKIKNVIKEKQKIEKQISHYNSIGHTAIAEKLKTQNKGLSVEGKSLLLSEARNKAQEQLVSTAKKLRNALTIGSIIAGLVAVTQKFGASLDKIGETFGSLSVMGKDFQTDLLASSVEATKLGGGIEDVAAITNTLASNFGMSVDEAAKLSTKVFDTSKAIGISGDEAANLFGTLMQTANLSADQAESLAEGAFQLARQKGVAPAAVLKDIAGSAEEIAAFTKDGGNNIADAAVQARQMGLSLSTTAKIAEGLLDFESSISNELEASVMIGKQLNFQKARQLALDGDIAGATKNIVDQVGSEAEFNKLNVLQRQSLAKSIGVSVSEMSKLVSGSEKLTLSGAMASSSFGDLLGEEGISNVSKLMNNFKALGATLINELGPTIENVLGSFTNFIEKGDGLEKIKGIITGVGSALQMLASNLPTIIGLMVGLKGVSIAAGIAQSFLAVSTAAAGTALIGGIGAAIIAGVIAKAVASSMTAVPKAQTGISGFGGGNLMVGESGPEIMNVPRGTGVTGAETTRQIMGGNDNKDVVNEQKRTNEGIATLTSAITNLNITAGRGTLKVAMEPALGGRGL